MSFTFLLRPGAGQCLLLSNFQAISFIFYLFWDCVQLKCLIGSKSNDKMLAKRMGIEYGILSDVQCSEQIRCSSSSEDDMKSPFIL